MIDFDLLSSWSYTYNSKMKAFNRDFWELRSKKKKSPLFVGKFSKTLYRGIGKSRKYLIKPLASLSFI
ncbi:hypothetical protein [Brunnivagina elsteri]|uniref:hypothetical protein n=1 Tax=Brunnivagina elsteri TaxID=1247191 RepID=UPI001B805646|nr:hypothetical protein [Calothrix elsteri]